MATRKQFYFSGSEYHFFNRGNHREHVFRDNEDRKYFLSKVDEYCERDCVSILAYCLMDNHFHLLLRQDGLRPVSGTMRSILTSYVKRINSKYGLVGHLFQGPYQTRWMNTQERLVYASRYIHRNPSKFTDIRTYRWSSYRQYLGSSSSSLANPDLILELFESKASYTTFVETASTPEIGKREGRFYLVENLESVAAQAQQSRA